MIRIISTRYHFVSIINWIECSSFLKIQSELCWLVCLFAMIVGLWVRCYTESQSQYRFSLFSLEWKPFWCNISQHYNLLLAVNWWFSSFKKIQPEVKGVDGLLEVYKTSFSRLGIRLAGPTYFAPVLHIPTHFYFWIFQFSFLLLLLLFVCLFIYLQSFVLFFFLEVIRAAASYAKRSEQAKGVGLSYVILLVHQNSHSNLGLFDLIPQTIFTFPQSTFIDHHRWWNKWFGGNEASNHSSFFTSYVNCNVSSFL
jgi:hypothetical protein